MDKTVVRWRQHLEATGSPERTITSYGRPLARLAVFLEQDSKSFADCNLGLLQAFVQEELDRYSPRSVQLAISALRAFGTWAVEAGLWRWNYATPLVGPADTMTPTNTCSPEDSLRLLRDGPEPGSPTYDRDRSLVRLSVLYGLKTGELERLRWTDVDFTGARLRVDGGPRRGPRFLGLDRETLSALRRERDALEDVPVFAGRDGRPMAARRLLHLLKAMGDRAGMKNVNFSAVRFAAVKETLERASRLGEVCDDLGFAHPSGPLRAAGRFSKS